MGIRELHFFLFYLLPLHGVAWIPVARATPLLTDMLISSRAPFRFTGHCRIVGPQCGTCFMVPFWHIEFGGGTYVSGRHVDTCRNTFLVYCTSLNVKNRLIRSHACCLCVCPPFKTLRFDLTDFHETWFGRLKHFIIQQMHKYIIRRYS